MNLEEFKQLYHDCGEVVAKLRISELDAKLNEIAQNFPQALSLMAIDPYTWSNLLIAYPEVYEFCDTSKFNNHCWGWLLAGQPNFANDCPWDTLSGSDWYFMIASQPIFIPEFNKLSSEHRRKLITETTFLKDFGVDVP